jgi:sigma-B regulation protein RsbU (phosphoserine phosphatase)
MRDKAYLITFLLAAGFLLYLGRDVIRGSVLIAWGLTFGGTVTVAVLVVALYRFRMELAASRHALALKDAELNFALQVQQALFPKHFPSTNGLSFSAVCLPARGISGDYYDVLSPADGRVAFAIADISGKGISAAIIMANLQALLRAVTATTRLPGDVCRSLNEHLHQVTDSSKFATFFYADWDRGARCLRYVNAGHNPPFLLNSRGKQKLDRGGIPLGVLPDWNYETSEVSLEPGDLLVLYSDGITEAGLAEGEEYGEARLSSLVASLKKSPLEEIQASVLRAVRDWSGVEPEDDMTLMIVRVEE